MGRERKEPEVEKYVFESAIGIFDAYVTEVWKVWHIIDGVQKVSERPPHPVDVPVAVRQQFGVDRIRWTWVAVNREAKGATAELRRWLYVPVVEWILFTQSAE